MSGINVVDIIIVVNAKKIGNVGAASSHRLPLIRQLAKQISPDGGKILIVEHYVSWINDIILNPWRLLNRLFNSKPRRIEENLFCFTPIIFGNLSLGQRFRFAEKSVKHQLKRQITKKLNALRFSRNNHRILWISHPYHSCYIALFDEAVSIYDCYDDFSLFGKEARDMNVLNQEKLLASKVDLILSGSRAHRERLSSFNENIYKFNSAFDSRKINSESIKINKIQRPIVGFCGCLKASDNIEMVKQIAKSKPQWSFVFVGEIAGPIKKGFDSFSRLPNVHYLGFQDQDRVIGLIKAFDVAIMPFKINELTNTYTPYKMYDYIGAQVPIASTPIREVLQFKDVIEIGEGVEGFTAAIERALLKDREEQAHRCRQIVDSENWNSRAKFVIELSNAMIEKIKNADASN